MFSVSQKADAAVTLEYPLWDMYAGASGVNTPSNAYTNIFCTSDLADQATLNFYSSTGAQFYTTSQTWAAGGSFGYLSTVDTAFHTAVAAMRDVTGATNSGKSYQFGRLQVVFANSSRGNMDIMSSTIGTMTNTSTTDGKQFAGGMTVLQAASQLTLQEDYTAITAGNNAGCFVDVILPVLSNASFSVPGTQVQAQ
ncbi:MAG: hypothetical protein HQK84_02105 [Nitrospinae bacterium]|nr:hypothetical protein [Nitrospinota bacterium]